MLSLRILPVLLVLTSFANAEFHLTLDPPADSDPPRQPFDKNTWSLDLAGSYITHIRWSEDYLTTGSVRLNYYIWKNVALNLGVSGYLIDQPNEDATAGSFDIGGRIHLLKFDGITIYFDGGGSRIFSDTAVPEGGTTYNWIGRVGGGATWHLFDNVHLMAGARYFHLSNGDVHGRINNPSYDGIESYVGLIFTF